MAIPGPAPARTSQIASLLSNRDASAANTATSTPLTDVRNGRYASAGSAPIPMTATSLSSAARRLSWSPAAP